MAKYLLGYHGGHMPETPGEQAQVMAAWEAWFGKLGGAVVDPGDPCGAARTISPGGSVGPQGVSSLSGYTLLSADTLDAAVSLARGCPVLAGGASVEVIEIIPTM
jgi:hypothetical protein